MQFPNLTYAWPRLSFTLIFNYKRNTPHKEKESHHPRRKTKRNKRKIRFKREIKGYARKKITEINWELNPSYSSLVFVFSIYSWGCVSWSKLSCLFFFCKSWIKFIYNWVINNLDSLLTENMCCCMFAIAFYFDSIYFYSLFRLITHLIIQVRREPQKDLS